MELKPRDIELFHEKYTKGASGECWEWTRGKDPKGYGRVKIRGYFFIASRLSFLIHNGYLPDDLLVCHSCDNPGCVNPDHLWLGTHKGNMQDMISKGRQRWVGQGGASNPRAVLGEPQAKEVIDLIAAGLDNKTIAARYGVTHSSISNIRRGKTWGRLRRPDDHPSFEPYGSLKAADRAAF